MKVQITIRGRRYTVRSDEDEIDLPAVAAYVDGRMSEVADRTGTRDDYTIAMLAALNIAEDFERFRRQVDDELAELDREVVSTMVLLDAVLPTDSEDVGEEE
jgi:cell division protein ZapA (FtsZ GTPase activity inhibitor)